MSQEIEFNEEPELGAPPPDMVAPPAPRDPPKPVKSYPSIAKKADKADPDQRGGAQRELQNEAERDVASWIRSLGSDREVHVNITRKKPIVGPDNENISGSLENVEGYIDEDYIRQTWGGGEFQLKVSLPNGKNGAMRWFQSMTVKIAGQPKMHGRDLNWNLGGHSNTIAAAPEHSTLAEKALDIAAQSQARAEQRAEEARREAREDRGGGMDLAAIQAFSAPIMTQLAEANRRADELARQLASVTTREAPRDELRDRMLTKAIDGDNAALEKMRTIYEARIESMRDRHDTEMTRERERNSDRITRLEDRHADELKRVEARHEREIKQIEDRHRDSKEALKLSYDARIDGVVTVKTQLETDLRAKETKIATLESTKNQSIGEKAEELAKLKETMSSLGLGGGDGEEEKWYEKLIGAVGNTEAAASFINKITGGPNGGQPAPQQQQQQQQLQPPVGVPFTAPDGNVYMRKADDTYVQIDQAKLRTQRNLQAARARKQQQAGAAPAAAGDEAAAAEGLDDAAAEPAVTPGRPPDEKETAMAINFMENAIKNNTPAAAFGQTARNLIPTDILVYMQHIGMDTFLNQAKLNPSSPLTTIKGRVFARQVAKFLSEGTTE